MLVAVGVELVHVPSRRHHAAHLVVADVEELQPGEVRHLRRDASPDGVVAQVHVAQLLRQLHRREAEGEAVAGQVQVLQRLPLAQHSRRVAGEGVARQVQMREADGGEPGGDGAGEVVVRQPEVRRLLIVGAALGEEQRRDGAREAVAAEVDGGEAGQVGERRRDGALERVEGEVEHGELRELGEELRDGAGDARGGDGELGEVGEQRERVRDVAREAREVAEDQRAEVGEVGDGVRDGAREVAVAEDGEADDAARGVVAVHVVPVAAEGVGRPRREVVRAAQRRVHRQQRLLVLLVALHLHRRRRPGRADDEAPHSKKRGGAHQWTDLLL